ncbi:hypothetical protein, partial [Bacillus safensis]|uniref:hypothetical protein n=1 Tax=Bacillus safensis TaxID=561879 RepID=UPI0022381C0D
IYGKKNLALDCLTKMNLRGKQRFDSNTSIILLIIDTWIENKTVLPAKMVLNKQLQIRRLFLFLSVF